MVREERTGKDTKHSIWRSLSVLHFLSGTIEYVSPTFTLCRRAKLSGFDEVRSVVTEVKGQADRNKARVQGKKEAQLPNMLQAWTDFFFAFFV